MPKRDARVDAYIERSHDFAKPVLKHLRKLVHKASPHLTETLKWSMPAFEHKGIVCGFASFKEHCTFGFWKESLLEKATFPAEKTAMGSFGRITSVKDLPADNVIIDLVRQAVELNEKGIKVEKKGPKPRKEVVVPDILLEALARNDKAAETFNAFPPSSKQDYIEWITEAKTDTTRDKRLTTSIEWLSEGKRRNWKYEKC
ncbi:MAG: YdeI/OmpD-associated family protein [Pyrinomonadaceae bacterium]|nr:YdeI/OmpD-associated family protein [Pyrinomonadaceae bacterium]